MYRLLVNLENSFAFEQTKNNIYIYLYIQSNNGVVCLSSFGENIKDKHRNDMALIKKQQNNVICLK